MNNRVSKAMLSQLYLKEQKSMMQIAAELKIPHSTVAYWMRKFEIPRRSLSEAIYVLNNPDGDPFTIRPILTMEDAYLLGMGLGLYWGEGTKRDRHTVRLGNTDPKLLGTFMEFLMNLFNVDKDRFRFGLQIFTDINPEAALDFWTASLGVKRSQFNKPVITSSGSIGTYRRKSQYGVVTICFSNKKLRDIVVGMLPS